MGGCSRLHLHVWIHYSFRRMGGRVVDSQPEGDTNPLLRRILEKQARA